MFGKTASKTETPQRRSTDQAGAAAEARKPVCAASLLSQGIVFEGQISGDGELHIEGEVRGDIVTARVVIGESARVIGTIRGEQVSIRGRVEGSIEAKTLKLFETARVEGDMVYEQLSIDAGAIFQGRCRQAEPKPTAEVIELDKTAVAG